MAPPLDILLPDLQPRLAHGVFIALDPFDPGILHIRSDHCDLFMIMLQQQVHRPVGRNFIINPHTVELFVLKRPVHQNDGDLILLRRLQKGSSHADRERNDPVHLPADQELQILRLNLFIIAGVAAHHPISPLSQLLSYVMQQHPRKIACNIMNHDAYDLCLIFHKSSCNLIDLIVQLMDCLFDQNLILWQYVSSIQVLGNRRH